MAEQNAKPSEQLLLAEMQVLLAQLRTQLSILRAGMALFGGAVTVYFLLDSNHWAVPGLAEFPQEIKGFLLIVALLGLWRFLSAERHARAQYRELGAQLGQEDLHFGEQKLLAWLGVLLCHTLQYT